jgi:hypothetical protein
VLCLLDPGFDRDKPFLQGPIGKKLYIVDRSRSRCEKFCLDNTNCKLTSKIREIIVAKNVTAGYFFVFVYNQNQGVQQDLTPVLDCLIETENKPNFCQRFIFKKDVDGRIILRWTFRKLEGVVGTGCSWLRIGKCGGPLWVQ